MRERRKEGERGGRHVGGREGGREVRREVRTEDNKIFPLEELWEPPQNTGHTKDKNIGGLMQTSNGV